MKKRYFLIVLVIAVLLLGGFLVWRRGRISEVASEAESEGVLIETSLEERPYVTMTPRADGKEFTLNISRIKNAKTIEYELVYLSNGLSRGVIGSITLKGETAVERELLLGTCSRNVCKYDEGVEEGTLTLRFRGEDGTRKFVSDFHLQQGEKELTSVDNNFNLRGTFSTSAFYLTMNTIGLPSEIEGKVIGGPYGVFTAGTQTVKNGEVSLKLEEENPSAKLFSWTGRAWQEMEKGFETDGRTVSASTTSLATFVAIAPEE